MANGWDIAARVLGIVANAPVEKIVLRRNYTKDIDRLEERLKERGLMAGEKAAMPSNPGPLVPVASAPPGVALPTEAETARELRRRVGKELYRAELDLQARLKIAAKPCDCLSDKHRLGLEATIEELSSKAPDPVYSEILGWFEINAEKLTVQASASGRYDEEYPAMAGELARFRKRVLGTTSLGAMITPKPSVEEAKALAARVAADEVERQRRRQI